MRCKKAVSLFSLFWEGELSGNLLSAYKEHLAQCTACSQAFEQFEKSLQLVKKLEPIQASPFLEKKLAAIIKSESSTRPSRVWSLQRALVPVLSSAAILAVLSTVLLPRLFSPDQAESPPVANVVSDISPVHYTSSQDEMNEANRKLSEAIEEHDLRDEYQGGQGNLEFSLDQVETNRAGIFQQFPVLDKQNRGTSLLDHEVDLEFTNESYWIPEFFNAEDEFAIDTMDLIPASSFDVTY